MISKSDNFSTAYLNHPYGSGIGTGGFNNFSEESFDWRGILGSHPSVATPAWTTLSSSLRGTGGEGDDDIFNDDVVLPKNCLEVENARYGRLPCVNDDDERLRNRMAAVQDDLVAILQDAVGVG